MRAQQEGRMRPPFATSIDPQQEAGTSREMRSAGPGAPFAFCQLNGTILP